VLDATPAGRAVYAQLGFRDGWAITRWEASCTSAVSLPRLADLTIRPIEARDWDAIAAFDAQAFGVDRSGLLRRLHARSQSFAGAAFEGETLQGFALGRDGARATYVGPIVARDDRVAVALVQAIVSRIASVAPGRVYLDALDAHPALAAALTHAGFRVQRPYTRMALGPERTIGDSARVYAIAGPELG
jgi:Acetyltransferase (GNAT) domain